MEDETMTVEPDIAQATPSTAWAYFSKWKAPTELLVRAGRAALRETKEAGLDAPSCGVRVWVEGDVEDYDSFDDFTEHATRSGLRRFHYIELAVSTPRLHITVTFVKGGVRSFVARADPPACPWLRRGVLVQVQTDTDAGRRRSAAARDRLVLALARGSNVAEERGETWNGAFPKPAVLESLDRRDSISPFARSATAIGTVYVSFFALALAAPVLPDFVIREEFDFLTGGTAGETVYRISPATAIVIVIASGLLGWFVLAPQWSFLGIASARVVVRERTLVNRATVWLTGTVAGLVAAALFTYLLTRSGIELE